MGAELFALEEAYIGTLSGRQAWKCLNVCIRRSDRGGRRRLRSDSGRSSAANALICSMQGSKLPAPPDVSSEFQDSMQRCWCSRKAARGFCSQALVTKLSRALGKLLCLPLAKPWKEQARLTSKQYL